jgi:hypothetical protein
MEALAEYMASVAARAHTEAEAEAMIGAAAVTYLTPADRRTLRRVLPHLVRGTAVLTRVLRRRRTTRPVIRAIPTILQRTNRTLIRRARAGRPVNRRVAARVMAAHTQRVLTSPRACATALGRNVRGARLASRPMSRGRGRRIPRR